MRSVLDRETILALNSSAAARPPYRLTAGDRIAIRFFYNKDLNDEVTIRPDGRISLQLIDEILVAGQTPTELSRALTEAYARSLGIPAARVGAPESYNPSDTYVLSVGERLSIKSFYHDRLNEDVTIRPDGRISMQLAGELQAAGVTPAQLTSAIIERLKKFIATPDISVIVREFRRPELSVIVRESAGQRIYVGGEVKQPSVIPMPDRLGLMAATMQAGGMLDTARAENVVLLRHDGTAEPQVYAVNLRAILDGQTPDVALRPLDVVFIPKSELAELGVNLRQIYALLPPNFVFSLGYQINPQVQVRD